MFLWGLFIFIIKVICGLVGLWGFAGCLAVLNRVLFEFGFALT